MAAFSAPSSKSRFLMWNTSWYSSGRNSSNTLHSRAVTPSRSPADSARIMPSISGRFFSATASANANSAGVGMPNSGLHSTIQQSGRAGSAVSRSPRPSARAVPPETQKGISLPTVSPMVRNCSTGISGAYRRRRQRNNAATSALPPPKPA